MSKHDQRCTPFSENISELWNSIKLVGHEVKNVVVELVRKARRKCKDEHEDPNNAS